MTDPAQTAHTTLETRRWAAEKLKQFFDTTVTIPEDPVDLDAEVGMLSAGVIPVEEVTYQMARKIAQQGAKLRPTV